VMVSANEDLELVAVRVYFLLCEAIRCLSLPPTLTFAKDYRKRMVLEVSYWPAGAAASSPGTMDQWCVLPQQSISYSLLNLAENMQNYRSPAGTTVTDGASLKRAQWLWLFTQTAGAAANPRFFMN
jgi:hypothetical protein